MWIVKFLFIIVTLTQKNTQGYIHSEGSIKTLNLTLAKNKAEEFSGNVSAMEAWTYRIILGKLTHSLTSLCGINKGVLQIDHDIETRLLVEMSVKKVSDFPVFFQLQQPIESITVQLPVDIKTIKRITELTSVSYTKASLMICVPLTDMESNVLIKVSTGSFELLPYEIKISVADTLQLPVDKFGHRTFLTITPMEPKYYYYPFTNTSQNVIVKVNSSNANCMGLSIQEPKCPVFQYDNFERGSDWEIISQTGAIRVNMQKYLKGFFIKVLLFANDSRCGNLNSNPTKRRHKTLTLVVEDDLAMSHLNSYFWLEIGIPPVICIIIGIIIAVIYLLPYSITRNRMVKCRAQKRVKDDYGVTIERFSRSKQDDHNPKETASYAFVKWTFIISIFFIIPILDQSIYNLLISRNGGMYNICSYNSLCSHPLWIFKDFNHMFSNICYLILGGIFIMITSIKSCLQKSDKEKGVKFNSGLFYSMGIALVFKGAINAAYHLCPSKANFQYDIIYLSVVISICLLKVAELRRPKTFNIDWCCGILGIVFLISSIGIVFQRYDEELTEEFFRFRIVVAVIHGITAFYVSVCSIFIMNPMKKLRKHQERTANSSVEMRQRDIEISDDIMESFDDIPRYPLPNCRWERLLYVFILLGLNGLLIYYSLSINYCIYVLLFLATNFGLNLTYYFFMKIIFGEFACHCKSIQVFFFLICAISFGVLSGYFFMMNLPEWTEPSTIARVGDEQCKWIFSNPFYDKHDAWHILSAHTLFFVFMVLLSIDDGVEGVDREYLLVF